MLDLVSWPAAALTQLLETGHHISVNDCCVMPGVGGHCKN